MPPKLNTPKDDEGKKDASNQVTEPKAPVRESAVAASRCLALRV